PLLSQYLAGTEASGLYEARLGFEQMPGKEVHVFCAAYREDEMEDVTACADHIVFNSISQLKRFGPAVKAAGKSAGIRINPECSTQDGHAIYDPCAPGSRMGVTRKVWDEQMDEETFALLEGIHFHTLCEQDADDLQTTLLAVKEKFGDVLPKMKWLNMGGGHHMTRPGYNIPLLEECIKQAAKDWQVQVYLEPGEAVALNAGYLASRVLDMVENGGVKIGILDASAACHMPDVIEMPYTPPLLQNSSDGLHTFRLAGPTCLAGDVIGDYAFEKPLEADDLLLFGDMAIYTTCKTNTFNGMPLPQIYAFRKDGSFKKLTDFGYRDFKNRLGS
ncbi:MAG: carboxynorspermidine decarboxylase, partial [Erysipelotrichaceae bacterium]|nr:carboxynorspermidine decarboxylase [Erysipelotrichaceae bacterium]